MTSRDTKTFNQIQLRESASYSYCARSWRQQTNPSRKKNSIRLKCYKTIGSYVSCAFKSCSRLCLEQLLRIFRAPQTSRVLHTSMNARWRINQLFIDELPKYFISRWTHRWRMNQLFYMKKTRIMVKYYSSF